MSTRHIRLIANLKNRALHSSALSVPVHIPDQLKRNKRKYIHAGTIPADFNSFNRCWLLKAIALCLDKQIFYAGPSGKVLGIGYVNPAFTVSAKS